MQQYACMTCCWVQSCAAVQRQHRYAPSGSGSVHVVLLQTYDCCVLWARGALTVHGTTGEAHSTTTLWWLELLKLLGTKRAATFGKRAADHALPLLLAALCLAGCWSNIWASC